MKPRTLLILLVVVLGLGAFIWFYERELPSSEERTALQKKVLPIEKDEVTAVTIESGRGQVRLERTAAKKKDQKDGKDEKDKEDGEEATEPAAEWRMTQPVAARADAFAVDRLLEAVAGLEKTRTLEDVDAKEVGLDKPRATLRLATKDGAKVLKLGAEVPPGGSLVAGLEGEKGAYVVSDTILAELEREPSEWRDKQMFRADREAVRRITLTAGAAEGPVALVKRPAGFWIERPIADRADRDLVDGLLSDLTGLTAERFLEGSRPLAEWNLAPPRETVQVEPPGSRAGSRRAGLGGDRRGSSRGRGERRAGLRAGGEHRVRGPHASGRVHPARAGGLAGAAALRPGRARRRVGHRAGRADLSRSHPFRHGLEARGHADLLPAGQRSAVRVDRRPR